MTARCKILAGRSCLAISDKPALANSGAAVSLAHSSAGWAGVTAARLKSAARGCIFWPPAASRGRRCDQRRGDRVDAERPVCAANIPFIHHSDSLSGSLAASSAPGGIGRGHFGKLISERAKLAPQSPDWRSGGQGRVDMMSSDTLGWNVRIDFSYLICSRLLGPRRPAASACSKAEFGRSLTARLRRFGVIFSRFSFSV